MSRHLEHDGPSNSAVGAKVRPAILWVGGGVVMTAAAARCVQAAIGSVPVAQAAGEVGILIALVTTSVALLVAGRDARVAGRILLCLTLVGFGAGVVAPLWSVAHPPAVLFEKMLGGAYREDGFPGPNRRGTFRLEIGRSRAGDDTSGRYVIHLLVGDRSERIEGDLAAEPSIFALTLDRRQPLKLFLEAGHRVRVTVREPPAPRTWFLLAGLACAVCAALADSLSAAPRRRGLFTLAVTAPVLYAVILGAEKVTGLRAAGAGIGGLFGAACFAVVTAGVAGLIGAASTRSGSGKPRARPRRS